MQRCHTYKIAVSKYKVRCEQRSEVFMKIQNFFFFFFFFFLGGGSQGGCEQRIEIFVKIQKKKSFLGWGGGGGVGLGGSGWM